jgi:hypothetical protein
MKIYLATWLTDRSLGRSLTKKKNSRRLLSYFFVKDQGISNELFNQYVEIGRCDPRKNK